MSIPLAGRRSASPRLFFAAPFRQWIDPSTGEVLHSHQLALRKVQRAFLDRGFSVFSAHEREAWGRALLQPRSCAELDFAEMQQADVVCAIVGSPPSAGVCIEIGWASSLGKPIVVVLSASEEHSALLEGIDAVSSAIVLRIDAFWSESAQRLMVQAVERALGGAPARRKRRAP